MHFVSRSLCQRFVISALFLVVWVRPSWADESDRLYDPSHLLDVKIQLEERDWVELCGQTRSMVASLGEESVESPFGYFRCTVTLDGVTLKNVGVRKKGFLGSLDSRRPSLKLNLDKYTKGVKFRGVDNITLNNCKQDTSYLSQYLTYRTFREAGLPAPRANFARVTVNGKDLGVYVNVEPVKKAFMRKNFGTSKGMIYEGTLADFDKNLIGRFERKTGKANREVREQFRTIAGILAKKPLDVPALAKHVDVPTFLRFWAIESLVGFWDGYCNNRNNFFCYVNPKDHRVQFIPWGADVSFVKSLLGALFFQSGRTQSVLARATLPSVLYQDESVRGMYFKELRRLLDTVWDEEELLKETQRVEKLLTPHVLDSRRREFLSSVAKVRRFIERRRKEITGELDKPEFPKPASPSPPPRSKVIGTSTGKFDSVWNESLSDEAKEMPIESLKFEFVDGRTIDLTELKLVIGSGRSGGRFQAGGPTIVFSGQRKKKPKLVTLSATIPRLLFRVGNRYPIVIQGNLVVTSEGFFAKATTLPVAGTVRFSAASTEAGKAVRGVMKLKVYEFSQGGG